MSSSEKITAEIASEQCKREKQLEAFATSASANGWNLKTEEGLEVLLMQTYIDSYKITEDGKPIRSLRVVLTVVLVVLCLSRQLKLTLSAMLKEPIRL